VLALPIAINQPSSSPQVIIAVPPQSKESARKLNPFDDEDEKEQASFNEFMYEAPLTDRNVDLNISDISIHAEQAKPVARNPFDDLFDEAEPAHESRDPDTKDKNPSHVEGSPQPDIEKSLIEQTFSPSSQDDKNALDDLSKKPKISLAKNIKAFLDQNQKK
jgi:hypothetical protein